MTINRDKHQDIRSTRRLIEAGRCGPFSDPSWLEHKGKGAILDYELLKGASKGQLVLNSGRKLSAVNAHLTHLKSEHGLRITITNDKYFINIPSIINETELPSKKIIKDGKKLIDTSTHMEDNSIIFAEDRLRIGKLVQNYIPKIFEYCEREDPNELSRLMDQDYSKRVFNINFPFCIEESKILDIELMRFWKIDFRIRNVTLRVCSQWYKESKPLFLAYLYSKDIISEKEYKGFKNFEYAPKPRPIREVQSMVKKEVVSAPIIQEEITKSAKFHEVLNEGSDSFFDLDLVDEAKEMSEYYKIFYSIERSIRALIVEVMEWKYGKLWWERKVNYQVKENVKRNLEYELDTPHSKRSEHNIDYSTFGDLRKIINTNWADFQPRFKRNEKSVNEILIDLNRIRVPIAHCTPLPKREIKRLEVRIEDWFDVLK